MRKPRPVQMWAVVIRSSRSRWIQYHTIGRTRSESIAKYVDLYRRELHCVIWRRGRRTGKVTCERVTVSVARG